MKVGIITMHRVIHYGSVLQAYALQQVLFRLGINNEIIDYVYPNAKHLPTKRISVISFIKNVVHLMLDFLCLKQSKDESNIRLFIKNDLIKTNRSFSSPEKLYKNCPKYDVYLTGSDQVWNTDYLNGDTSFFFSFVSDGKKISYASSFGRFTFSGEKAEEWLANLKSYTAISVREQKAVDIIRHNINRDAELVLDPTLLLDKQYWMNFARKSDVIDDDGYILVYVLTYAWNPFPFAEDVIRFYEKKLGLKVLVLEPALIIQNNPNWILVKNVSPREFVSLFLNASLVITTSFHGTAFSVNLETPFFSIINENTVNDDRITSLLHVVGLSDRGIANNSKLPVLTTPNFKESSNKLAIEREKSIAFLKTNC